jgi:hypothetical protein
MGRGHRAGRHDTRRHHPAGGRTVENRFRFSNVVLRLGVSRETAFADLKGRLASSSASPCARFAIGSLRATVWR